MMSKLELAEDWMREQLTLKRGLSTSVPPTPTTDGEGFVSED